MSPSIEDTIDRVEQLYTTITGVPPPESAAATTRMPPEIDPARHVEDQLGRLLAAVQQQIAPDTQAQTWQPRVFAWRDDTGFELALDVPGIAREHLELRVEGQRLVVRGDRQPPWGTVDLPRPPDAREAPLGAFMRSFVLPVAVEPDHVTARLEHGVLRVRIAYRTPAEPSPIPIQG